MINKIKVLLHILRYRVPKSVSAKDDFGHFQTSDSMPTVPYDWQGMTSYYCCILTLGLIGSLLSYKPLKLAEA